MKRLLLLILVSLFVPLPAAAAARAQYASVRAGPATEAAAKVPRSGGKRRGKKKPAAGASRRTAAASAIRAASPVGAASLGEDLRSIVARSVRAGRWGVLVVSLANGDTLFDHGADDEFRPASTMKLFTSAVALDRFGPNGRFETDVLRSGAIGTDGILRGNLVLRGAGDPTLAGKAAADAVEPPMDALAVQVAAAGVRRITGSIIADASAFDDGRVPEGWRSRYLHAFYAARVSALSFNENRIAVVVRPTPSGAEISFDPAVSGIPLANQLRLVKGSRGARVFIRQDSTSGLLSVRGWIGTASAPRDYEFVTEKPELIAAGALRAALIAHAIAVDGAVRSGTEPAAVRLAAVESPTLEKIVTQMNGESNNHFAELLFRDAARSTGVAGSAENGNILLRRFVSEKMNVPATSVFAADGSGLSTLDRVTPRTMVRLLGYARQASWGPVFEQSLPVAGETETLRHRMRYTLARGNLHAKTGTTNEVASLGGYVTAKNGELLAFSFLYNGRDRWRAKEAIDAMGTTLANFTR